METLGHLHAKGHWMTEAHIQVTLSLQPQKKSHISIKTFLFTE